MDEYPARSASDTFPEGVVLATRRLGDREWFVLTCSHDSGPPPAGLRADLVVPIVLVTANAAQRERIVSDLRAHVEAVVTSQQTAENAQATVAGELLIARSPLRVTVDGREIGLSGREFRVLDALVARANHAVSRDDILREAWSGPFDEPTRRVDVMIARIRSKLGTAGRFIQAVRGVGYRFVEVAAMAPAHSESEVARCAAPSDAAGVTAAGREAAMPRTSVRMAS
ncbi:MAG: winged helix-turn-helix domain-containing protein [Polyangiaceae bacterium]|jgi:DNA-binding winged helix-turn-helix (wHTH) protein